MGLSKIEAKEWASLQAKSKRHEITVKRVGPANVEFTGDVLSKGVYAQLGTGRATTIMDARIKVNKELSRYRLLTNKRLRRYK
mgnify:CR=1 FL=1